MAAKRYGFSQVKEHIGQHVTRDELLRLLGEGDATISMTAFEGLELADVRANGATFDQVIFRSCQFEGVDFSNCSLADVRFVGCRFIACTMERSWLNRCDFEGCSAPGLSFQKGRLTSVCFDESQLRYADFSEAAARVLAARKTSLAESAWHSARLKHVLLDGCDLSRADMFGTSLAGIDLSTCDISGIVVSSTFHELRGCTVSPTQAAELVTLLGVRVSDE